MGTPGVDIQLSSKALDAFPFAVECKCVEKVNLWEAWSQANAHALHESARHSKAIIPLLVIKRSRERKIAVIDFEALMAVLGLLESFR